MKENLIIVRDILFTSFIIGFILYVLSFLLWMFKFDYFYNITNHIFGIEKEYYTFAAILIMGMAKNVLFFLFLIPAIAIHLKIKCKCKNIK
ncbi:MAG: hypothetical protein WC197_02245 [Candidatus Gastranaerophilaceae bacterium]|jgi:hypothetical protein